MIKVNGNKAEVARSSGRISSFPKNKGRPFHEERRAKNIKERKFWLEQRRKSGPG